MTATTHPLCDPLGWLLAGHEHGGHGGHRHEGHGGPWGRRGGGPGWGFRGGAGFPFGGPPFAGPMFGGGRGMGGRRAGRGDVRASVLALLAERPMHGYQIITELTERSGGGWRPSPGSVYPVLQQLQDEGLVRPEDVEGRRVFHLTEEGRAYVQDRAEDLRAPWETVGGGHAVGSGLLSLWHAFQQVAAAAWQVAQAGGDAQVAQARDVLDRARRDLYRILAEGEPVEEGDGPEDAGPEDAGPTPEAGPPPR